MALLLARVARVVPMTRGAAAFHVSRAVASDAAAAAVPEERLAKNQMYYWSMTYKYVNDGTVEQDRLDRLTDPKQLVMVARAFADRGIVAKEIFDGLESKRFTPETLGQLDAEHLTALARAYATVGCGSPAFFSAISAAISKLPSAPEAHTAANLAAALNHVGAAAK